MLRAPSRKANGSDVALGYEASGRLRNRGQSIVNRGLWSLVHLNRGAKRAASNLKKKTGVFFAQEWLLIIAKQAHRSCRLTLLVRATAARLRPGFEVRDVVDFRICCGVMPVVSRAHVLEEIPQVLAVRKNRAKDSLLNSITLVKLPIAVVRKQKTVLGML